MEFNGSVLSVSVTIEIKMFTVPKYKDFSDYWLRTSAEIHVYMARARRTGYSIFISVYIL